MPNPADNPMHAAIVRVIESIPPGQTRSYADVARDAGCPGRHRLVGRILSVSLDALPWWRVVYADGRLPPVNPTLQQNKLIDEGVRVEGFRVVPGRHHSNERQDY